jgi:hypothetical protein
MAVVDDIDYNSGLTAQLDIAKEYNVQVHNLYEFKMN